MMSMDETREGSAMAGEPNRPVDATVVLMPRDLIAAALFLSTPVMEANP